MLASARTRGLYPAFFALALSSCAWFTDFKDQPKIDPWQSVADTIPPRGSPQASVSIYGTVAPGFAYGRLATLGDVSAMSGIANPVPADSASLARGRVLYQINCAVCHGAAGMGDGPAVRYGMVPIRIGAGSNTATALSDGYIFGIIRNGRGLMPSYNRIEEAGRWDVVNYLRGLEGRGGLQVIAEPLGRPGETGALLPGATRMAPQRPAPHYRHTGTQAGAPERTEPTTPGGQP